MPEAEIYDCCVKWAEAQLKKEYREITKTNLRRELKEVLQHIRFPLMSASDFVLALLPHPGVLTDEEELHVYRFIYRRDLHLGTGDFNTDIA